MQVPTEETFSSAEKIANFAGQSKATSLNPQKYLVPKFSVALEPYFCDRVAEICAMITIAHEDPHSPDATRLLSAFIEDVKNRYDFSPKDVGEFDPELVSAPRSVFLIARRDGKAVGCGALVPIDEFHVEVKRTFVDREERGLGIATIILEELEHLAREFGYDVMRLETGNRQPESIALYAKAGFYRIPNYPPFENDHSALCFEKRI
jgi:putative acetyltransferase